ncbi:hypothetical protein PQX77_019166 [Marasmius sp. AFHP31]|nr:hypothetical protein PQX77_019166 [Marasmius sp. AFHP31]
MPVALPIAPERWKLTHATHHEFYKWDRSIVDLVSFQVKLHGTVSAFKDRKYTYNTKSSTWHSIYLWEIHNLYLRKLALNWQRIRAWLPEDVVVYPQRPTKNTNLPLMVTRGEFKNMVVTNVAGVRNELYVLPVVPSTGEVDVKTETLKNRDSIRAVGYTNEKGDAIRELEHMKQGSKAFTVYSEDLRDAGAKTGLSDTKLMIRFQSGLNPEVKKLLVTIDLAQGDPKDLDNLEDRSCRAERALEAEGFSTRKRTETTTTISATIPTHATQTNPVGGNGKTRDNFMRAMRNRCYGCGATDHTKAQENHGQEQCHHCKHFGHCTSVCQDKFLGRMPGLGLRPARVVRINSAVPFTLFPGETVNIGTSPPAPTTTIASTVPSTQVSTSYTPSSNTVARIAALQDSLNQQNAMIQQLMGQKDFSSGCPPSLQQRHPHQFISMQLPHMILFTPIQYLQLTK